MVARSALCQPGDRATIAAARRPTSQWSSFEVPLRSASPGQTLGLTTSAPGGVLFGEHIGQPYQMANLNVNYLLVSKAKSKFGIAFQVRNLFNERVQQTPVQAVDVSLRGHEAFAKVYWKF